MSVYSDVLGAVASLANQTEPYTPVAEGFTPGENSLTIAWSASTVSPFFSKKAAVEMTALLNGKHSSQELVANALGKIHTSLSMRKDYPLTDCYQITDISTLRGPSCLGQDENKQWLYGSSLRVRFFLKGDH